MTNKEILFNTLKFIDKNKSLPDIVSSTYIKALEEIGFINDGWDVYLTELGKDTLSNLRRVYEQW